MKTPIHQYAAQIDGPSYPPTGGGGGRPYQPSWVNRKNRRRKQRLTLLTFISLLIAGITLVIVGLCQSVPRFLEPISIHTQAFDTFMDNQFGLWETPSLLYYQNLDYVTLTHRTNDVPTNQLLPIMPVSEDISLKQKLEQLFSQYSPSKYIVHFYFYNPQTAQSVNINGYSPAPAASVIKLSVLFDYLMSLDENVITPDTPLLYADFHRGGGAGDLQYQAAGQSFPANQVAAQMIRISDNTCTNMMISYLGGMDKVNKRLEALGLMSTRIRNFLPDLEGTNTISPYEMVTLLYNLDTSPLFSDAARSDGLQILESVHNRRLLVWTLPPEAKIAHKTGDIATALGDSGLVYLPDGRKYFVSIQVERPYNDYTPRDMVQKMSRLIYDDVAKQTI